MAGVAAGAAVGSVVGGPVGAVVGGTAGAILGALGGYAAVDAADPDYGYWRDNFRSQPGLVGDYNFEDDYAPAYRMGLRDVQQHQGRPYEEVQETLAQDWDIYRGKSRLTWPEASPAARAAWERAQHLTMSS